MRVAVVEFPPSLRTLLVRDSHDGSYSPYRCQLPYLILAIIYARSAGGCSLDDSLDWGRSYCPVYQYFRASPMTSIDSPLYNTPFRHQHGGGKTCFGYDTAMLDKLFSKHRNLRALVQTVTESFWGTSFYPDTLKTCLRAGHRHVGTFAEWARESNNPDFLGTVNWEQSAVNIQTWMTFRGRFNPGHRE